MAAKKSVQKPAPATSADIDRVVEQVSSLSDSIVSLVEVLRQPQVAAAPVAVVPVVEVPETPEQKEITKAGPKKFHQINPEWEEKAREVLGDYLDHCEVDYPKAGGTVFTVVVNTEKSNAPEEYLKAHKEDRRSREIGNEGLEGVEQWCKLVKANLLRPR